MLDRAEFRQWSLIVSWGMQLQQPVSSLSRQAAGISSQPWLAFPKSSVSPCGSRVNGSFAGPEVKFDPRRFRLYRECEVRQSCQ